MTEKNTNSVSAFRKYARYGYDNADFNIFEMCEAAKGATSNERDAAELVAVYLTLRTLEFTDRTETADLVKKVYFKYASRPLKKNEISLRVRRFATDSYMDERTVYRHLRIAKELFLNFCEIGIKNLKKFEKNY